MFVIALCLPIAIAVSAVFNIFSDDSEEGGGEEEIIPLL